MSAPAETAPWEATDAKWFVQTGHCGHCGNPGSRCWCEPTSPCGCGDLHPMGSGLLPESSS